MAAAAVAAKAGGALASRPLELVPQPLANRTHAPRSLLLQPPPGAGPECPEGPGTGAAPSGSLPPAQGQSQPWLPLWAGLLCVLPGPGFSPWAAGAVAGQGGLWWQLLLQGWFWPVSLHGAPAQAAALPPGSPPGPLGFVAGTAWAQGRQGACRPQLWGNRERPGRIQCAAGSAVVHITGSRSPLLPQMCLASQTQMPRTRRAAREFSAPRMCASPAW